MFDKNVLFVKIPSISHERVRNLAFGTFIAIYDSFCNEINRNYLALKTRIENTKIFSDEMAIVALICDV